MSWWTKIVRPVATTVLRGVAAVYTGGASEALLAATGQSGLGIADLLPKAKETGDALIDQAQQRYPNIAALVNTVRDVRSFTPARGIESAADYSDEDYVDEDYADEEDY